MPREDLLVSETLRAPVRAGGDYYAKGESFLQQPTVENHSAATGAATGIIGLLEVAQSDFTKLLADAEVEEQAAVRESLPQPLRGI